MTEELLKLIILSGPTGSGKSELAIELASLLGAEILNADSMQVYRGMDIGTAKLPISERKGIPHHVIDIVNPDQEFNAALFRSHALPIIDDLNTRGIPIIVVGGTGLYVKSLLGGLFTCPPSQRALRQELWKQCEDRGAAPGFGGRRDCGDGVSGKDRGGDFEARVGRSQQRPDQCETLAKTRAQEGFIIISGV